MSDVAWPAHEPGREERIFTLAGVLIALLLAGLDQTIVSTAGPAIQRDLRLPTKLYPWITTSYLVASTVTMPIWGKLSDRLGRKPVLVAGVGLFLVGSLFSGLAPGAATLISARAFQGLGAASLFTSAFAVIADLFPPAVRGKYMGLMGGVMGVSSVIGPLVGGFITDHISWHWCFFVNLPIGGLALWFILARMPALHYPTQHALRGGPLGPRVSTAARIDVAGALWLMVALVPLLLALSLGRAHAAPGQSGLAWTSPPVLAMLALSVVALVVFLRVERRAHDPILDLRLFRNRTIFFGAAASFVIGAGFFFAIVFLPLFMVNVVGVSATRSGLTLTPLTLGTVAGGVGAGQLVSHFGRYKRLMLGSLVLLMAGFAVMGFTLTAESTHAEVTLKMILIGVGLGPSFPLYTLVVQNAARPQDVGIATAATTFSRGVGAILGVTVFGTIFAGVLGGGLARGMSDAVAGLPEGARALVAQVAPAARGGGDGATLAFDEGSARARIRRAAGGAESRDVALALGSLDAVGRGVKQAVTEATRTLYRFGVLVILVAFILTALMPEIPLRTHHGEAPPPAVPPTGE